MKREVLKKLLEQVRKGTIPVTQALERLRILPYEELGFATLDHHRLIRQGIPEVIYCEGKRREQVVQIIRRMKASGVDILATRATRELYEAIRQVDLRAQYNDMARTVVIKVKGRMSKDKGQGSVLILTAGTSDLPVAEEARVTLELLGSQVSTLYDVGVAGIHRLMDKRGLMEKARVLIVVAGMDGVLASVVGGLADQPVIAVPTSQGYGASFGGISALLTMLNSCAAGVGVVNIDNGFGAGCLAHRINIAGERR
ncbi:MAG: nickel pincer cofactor biosynthesis protein LarB [Nitrospiria bacterium]